MKNWRHFVKFVLNLLIYQAALQEEKSGNTPQEKQGKGSTKKKSGEQKSSTRSQPSTANGSNWNVKQVVGAVVGVICLIIVFAAVVQRKSSISKHAGMNVHVFESCYMYFQTVQYSV